MAVITLTTDFGTKDYLLAGVKGAILNELPNAIIVDISHKISPFDIAEAAFILKNAYHSFPKGSIHIIGVDALTLPNKKPIVALIDEHYFIGSDNGILSLICADINPKQIVKINIPQVDSAKKFPTRDLFVPIACHIFRGGKLTVIGSNIKEINSLHTLNPTVKENKTIVGTVIYIDNFGNAITNITQKFYNRVGKKRNARIWFRNYEFNQIFENYTDIVKNQQQEEMYFGKEMLLFGSSGFLEIAIYKSNPQTVGSASTLLGLKKGDTINIEFE